MKAYGNIIQKIKLLPAPTKASIVFMFANIFHQGLNFLVAPIFTRLLNTSEYGQISIFTSCFQVVGIFAMLCLSYGVFNNGMLDFDGDRDRFMFSMLMLSNVATIFFAILAFVTYDLYEQYIDIAFSLVVLMFFLYLFQPAYNYWFARQRFEFKYKLSALVNIVTSIIAPVAAIICIFLFPENKVIARIVGFYLPLLPFYLFFYILLFYRSKGKVNLRYWKFALKFNLPLIPHYLSLYILNSSDKIMISALVSSSAAGIYSIAYSVSAIVTVVWNATNASLVPYTYEQCKKRNFFGLAKVVHLLLFLFALFCSVIIFLAPEVIAVLAPNSYHEGIYVIPAVVGGVFFTAMYFVFGNIVYYYKKPIYVMAASITSAGFNILLNFLLIPVFGFIAAGYTTLFSYIVQAIMDYFAMRKITTERIYDVKLLLGLSAYILFIVFLSGIVYSYPVIRYALLVVLIAIGIFTKNRWISIIQVIRKP